MITEPWTEQDYKFWKKSRSFDSSKWRRDHCAKADALIRSVATERFIVYARTTITNPTVRAFLISMVKCHFGSVEVDEMLTRLNCYPDWM